MTEYTGDLWLKDMGYLQPLVPEFTDDQAEKFHARVNLSVSVGVPRDKARTLAYQHIIGEIRYAKKC